MHDERDVAADGESTASESHRVEFFKRAASALQGKFTDADARLLRQWLFAESRSSAKLAPMLPRSPSRRRGSSSRPRECRARRTRTRQSRADPARDDDP